MFSCCLRCWLVVLIFLLFCKMDIEIVFVIFQIGNGHSGTKSSKVVFAGDSDYLVTSGMNRMSNRQIALWKQVL